MSDNCSSSDYFLKSLPVGFRTKFEPQNYNLDNDFSEDKDVDKNILYVLSTKYGVNIYPVGTLRGNNLSDFLFASIQIKKKGWDKNAWPYVMNNGKKSYLGTFKGGLVNLDHDSILEQFNKKDIPVILIALKKNKVTPKIMNDMVRDGFVHGVNPSGPNPLYNFASIEDELYCQEGCKYATEGKKHYPDDVITTVTTTTTIYNSDDEDNDKPPDDFEHATNAHIKDISNVIDHIDEELIVYVAKLNFESDPKIAAPSIFGVTLVDNELVPVWNFPGVDKMFNHNGLAPYDNKMVSYLISK